MDTLKFIRERRQKAKKNIEIFQNSRDFKEMRQHEKRPPKPYRDKTFLYIKGYDSDTGNRPMPSGTVFWMSPDIEIFDGTTPIANNQLVAGKNYQIAVTVRNGGDLPCYSCHVELFICNPSLGFDPIHGTLLGVQTAQVQAQGDTTLSFPIVATSTMIGHRCLFARVFSFVNNDLPSSATTFPVVEDRHIGQQNLNIIQQNNFVKVLMTNEFAAQKNFQVKVVPRKMDVIKGTRIPQLRRLISPLQAVVLPEFSIKPLKVNAGIEINRMRATTPNRALLVRNPALEVANLAVLAPVRKNLWDFKLEKGTRELEVAIPDFKLKNNEAVVVDIELTDADQNKVVGGIRFVVTA
ncbi:hypothetical protein FHS57_004723 [Runella defluvii]|uniref:Uncharacterized protein n=1 Tax=Runella defluvii TaxID=370973 RepID=A0A7W6ESJ9_9BACT|nr:hypothetical protein [Runella defluvii]MBB3840703.1 hypothetical protein [Runella defluvii]